MHALVDTLPRKEKRVEFEFRTQVDTLAERLAVVKIQTVAYTLGKV